MLLVRPSRTRRPRRPQLSRPKSAFAAQISDCDPKIQERSPQRPMKKHSSYFFPFPIFHILPILLLTPFLLLASARTISQETMAARIAPDILRFHVLAESNSPKDQSLKLGVRDILLSHIQTRPQKRHQAPTGPLDPPAKKHPHPDRRKLAYIPGLPSPCIPYSDQRLFPHKILRRSLLPLRRL